MKDYSLYLECRSGISGDMTVAALLDLGADRDILNKALQSLPIKGFRTSITRVEKGGLTACDFMVILDEEYENHDHDMQYLHGTDCPADGEMETGTSKDGSNASDGFRTLSDIRDILFRAEITENARELSFRIFDILARGEAKAHGVGTDQVQFHEKGAVDTIVDIVSVAVCMDNLGINKVFVSPLCEGRGFVRSRHGMLPVPVPAVANIVADNGLSLRITDYEGEFVTPTGAAIAAALKTTDTLPKRFKTHRMGLGAGKREYELPGVLWAIIISED